MAYKVFIDGQAGTTGLRLAERLSSRSDIELIDIEETLRKDVNTRLECMREADISFLCLPDDGARQIVCAVESDSVFSNVKIIDASTAHRTTDGWIYGMPELYEDISVIEEATRVSNPGCHATGYILTLKPLVSAGMISEDAAIFVHSITGYSGGGKQMIATYEENGPRIECGDGMCSPRRDGMRSPRQDEMRSPRGDGMCSPRRDGMRSPRQDEMRSPRRDGMCSPRQYGLTQSHKHLPEMVAYSRVNSAPTFSPIVADYYSGMLVSVALPKVGTIKSIRDVLGDYYNGRPMVKVRELGYNPEEGFLAADALTGRDDLEIIVTGSDERVTVICRYDNLGKGASGAAIQNMNLMLGLPESAGLMIE